MIRTGQLLILSGPSGVGKDTVIDAWGLVNSNIERVVAATSRAPRTGETDGVDYHFMTAEEFQQLAERGGFLEHKLVHGSHYGTPLASLERLLEQGRVAILKIDVQGALTVMELRPEALSVFLLPPSDAELENRLRSRASDSPEAIEKRLETARWEIAQAGHYQSRIVNEDVDAVVRELETLLSE